MASLETNTAKHVIGTPCGPHDEACSELPRDAHASVSLTMTSVVARTHRQHSVRAARSVRRVQEQRHPVNRGLVDVAATAGAAGVSDASGAPPGGAPTGQLSVAGS